MADHKKIARHLELVLKSQCFSKSAVNRTLLKYLIEATIKGENPKEFQIAHDVFGKKGDDDKEINIRVYILNLRKKLEEYYDREGRDDEIKFEIPKGSYNVNFHTNVYKTYSKFIYKIAPGLLLLSLILLILTYTLYQHRKSPQTVRRSFWSEIVKSQDPLMLILGDHYFFHLNGNNPVSGSIRIPGINNDGDLEKFINKNPDLLNRINKTNQTYINTQAPFGLYKIMDMLGGGLTDIEMMYSSQLRWDDMKNKNVIFIGSYKTQNILEIINQKIGINYDVKSGVLNYTTGDSTIIFNNRSGDLIDREFASFSHFVTDRGNKIVFFMCDNDVGNMATLKFLTEMEGLNKLEKMINEIGTSNYNAVFEVRGKDKTDFEINIIRLDPITAPISEVWP